MHLFEPGERTEAQCLIPPRHEQFPMFNMIRQFISALITGTTNIINFTLSIQTLIFVKFFFGIYQDFKCNIILTRLAAMYCIIVNTIVPIRYLLGSSASFKYIAGFFEHFFIVLCSICMKSEYLHDYIAEIMRIDAKLGLKSNKVETLFLRIFCFIILIILYFFFFSGISQSSKSHVIGNFVTVTHIVSYIPTIIMLELFRNRVRLLQTSIELCFAHDTKFQEETITYKLKKIKKYIYIYKHLLDNITNNFNYIKFVVMLRLAVTFKHTMIIAHTFLANIPNETEGDTTVGTLIYLVITVSLTCMPPLLAELAANEVDKIKSILTDQLLICTDAALREGLEDALTYLRVRHFRCVVWRAIPIGISTLLAFIALCTNYLIVMMQFMKS